MTTLTAPTLPGPPSAPVGMPRVVAHRGNSAVAPENTIVALEAAARAGADLVEIDLQLTRDGVAVVIHDDDVDRTTDGTGRVDQLDGAYVTGLDAGAWFAPAYRGARVPTVAELLELVVGHPALGLLAEFKGGWEPAAVRAVTDAVEHAGLCDRVIVQSFDVATVGALRDVAPDLARGLLIEEVPDDLVVLCDALAVMTCNPGGHVLLERPELVDTLHGEGVRVMPWTLNEPAHWAAAVRLGVDAIITDRPDRLRGWIERAAG